MRIHEYEKDLSSHSFNLLFNTKWPPAIYLPLQTANENLANEQDLNHRCQ